MIEQWPYDEWNWSQLREEVTRLASENERMQACARDRLAEVQGDVTTYEDAFRKLEIACAALRYIAEIEVSVTLLAARRMGRQAND